MLGKLMKYDLKSMLRTFAPLWILTPVVSLLFGLTVWGSYGSEGEQTRLKSRVELLFGMGENVSDIVGVVMALVFFGILVALAVVTVLFVIQRFWNGLLKDEGYLMFTLPVKPWELITAKGLCATIAVTVSVLVGFFSFFVIYCVSIAHLFSLFGVWDQMKDLLWDFLRSIDVSGAWLTFFLLEFAVLMILSLTKSIYSVYAAMALGQLFEAHRVAGAVAAYFGLSVVLSVIANLLSSLFGIDTASRFWLLIGVSSDDVFLSMAAGILLTLAQIVIFHVITERVLSTRLNLE